MILIDNNNQVETLRFTDLCTIYLIPVFLEPVEICPEQDWKGLFYTSLALIVCATISDLTHNFAEMELTILSSR